MVRKCPEFRYDSPPTGGPPILHLGPRALGLVYLSTGSVQSRDHAFILFFNRDLVLSHGLANTTLSLRLCMIRAGSPTVCMNRQRSGRATDAGRALTLSHLHS